MISRASKGVMGIQKHWGPLSSSHRMQIRAGQRLLMLVIGSTS